MFQRAPRSCVYFKIQKELNNSRKYRDKYNDMIIVKILHLKILCNHKILAHISQSCYWGIDRNSQKPGSSELKPGTGRWCLLLRFGFCLLTVGSWQSYSDMWTQ